MSSWLGLMIPAAPITQWWEQVANMELAEWGGALRGSCGGSSLLTLSLGRQSCELIPRSPDPSGHSLRPPASQGSPVPASSALAEFHCTQKPAPATSCQRITPYHHHQS